MNERELLIYLHSLNGVGIKSLSKLVTNLPTLSTVLQLQPLELSIQAGVDFSIAQKIIDGCNETAIKQFFSKYQDWLRSGVEIVTIYDQAYPYLLKEIPDPPLVIFGIGELELLQKPAVAIVGTRSPTSYGRYAAEVLAKELTEYGLTIVSGLAKGVDRLAHEGALKAVGKTVAVLGCGVDVIYPLENMKLYQQIIKQGLIISEYPPGTKAHPGFFPQRNRIISGMAYGTIVVEAAERSGSLITAQAALEQAREVFAVPGPINSKKSQGVNSLIQQGAKLIQNGADVVEELPYLNLTKKTSAKSSINLSKVEEAVFSQIQFVPIHTDELYDKLPLNLTNIYEALLSLQIKGKIKQLPGGLYIREV